MIRREVEKGGKGEADRREVERARKGNSERW